MLVQYSSSLRRHIRHIRFPDPIGARPRLVISMGCLLVIGLVLAALNLRSIRIFQRANELAYKTSRLPFTNNTIVDVDYARYRGVAMENGVTEWLGLRFAAPPLGDKRFARPKDPLPENEVTEAQSFGPLCLGTNEGPPTLEMDEDCLFLNVFVPSSASAQSRLPVFFYIQGGGFNSNGQANYNGSGLIHAAEMDMVVVNFNYRVGPYGFLAGKEVRSSNNGLFDQRKALQWTQQYISRFGGDPTRVTIAGASAGAQSVDLHILAFNGRNDHLFHAAASISPSYPPIRTIAENQFAYDNLVIRTGCALWHDTLDCLRRLTATELQAYNYPTTFPSAQSPPFAMYGPTLDDDLIRRPTVAAYRAGHFISVPRLIGTSTDEGSVFLARNVSLGVGHTFLRSQFPSLAPRLIRLLAPNQPSASALYGALRYACPSQLVALLSARDAHTWLFRWNAQDARTVDRGLGTPHAQATQAVWGPENTRGEAPESFYRGGDNAALVAATQAYWTAFVRWGQPGRGTRGDLPEWEKLQTGRAARTRRMKFQGEGQGVEMEAVSTEDQRHCEALTDAAGVLGQ